MCELQDTVIVTEALKLSGCGTVHIAISEETREDGESGGKCLKR